MSFDVEVAIRWLLELGLNEYGFIEHVAAEGLEYSAQRNGDMRRTRVSSV